MDGFAGCHANLTQSHLAPHCNLIYRVRFSSFKHKITWSTRLCLITNVGVKYGTRNLGSKHAHIRMKELFDVVAEPHKPIALIKS